MKKPSSIDHTAPDTPRNIVDFAQRHAFSPGENIGPVPAGAPLRRLQRVLCDLLENEISAGLQTFPFDCFRVWIGDDLNGLVAEATFEDESVWGDDGAIAHWLHETAIGLYLESEYAKRHSRWSGARPTNGVLEVSLGRSTKRQQMRRGRWSASPCWRGSIAGARR